MSKKTHRLVAHSVRPIADSCPDRAHGSALDRRCDALLDNSESDDAEAPTPKVSDCSALSRRLNCLSDKSDSNDAEAATLADLDRPALVAAPSGMMHLDVIWYDALTLELVPEPEAVARPGAVALHLDAHNAAQRTLPSCLLDVAIDASTLPRPAAREGSLLRAAISKIDRIIERRPTVFKIGITNNPAKRFYNPRYGYQLDGFRTMRLLWASDVRAGIAMLEAALILQYEGTPGFRNVATGGEGPPNRTPPFFCYVVTMPADERVRK